MSAISPGLERVVSCRKCAVDLSGTLPAVTLAGCPSGDPSVDTFVCPPVVGGLQLMRVCGCAGLVPRAEATLEGLDFSQGHLPGGVGWELL